MKITDEAVRAAVVAMNTNNLVAYDSLIAQQEANARSILTAALPHLQPVDVAAARETGFREGLEAAAKWHEEHAIGYETEYSNLNIADELAVEHRGSATAIRALSSEPAQGDQWQPIETAPETGKGNWLPNEAVRGQALIIKLDDGRMIYEAYLRHGSWCFEKWAKDFTVTSVVRGAKPTHWMPLPAAPTSKGGG